LNDITKDALLEQLKNSEWYMYYVKC
jgi:hypothetical protein